MQWCSINFQRFRDIERINSANGKFKRFQQMPDTEWHYASGILSFPIQILGPEHEEYKFSGGWKRQAFERASVYCIVCVCVCVFICVGNKPETYKYQTRNRFELEFRLDGFKHKGEQQTFGRDFGMKFIVYSVFSTRSQIRRPPWRWTDLRIRLSFFFSLLLSAAVAVFFIFVQVLDVTFSFNILVKKKML